MTDVIILCYTIIQFIVFESISKFFSYFRVLVPNKHSTVI